MDAPSSPPATPTAYGIPIRNLWYLLLYAWHETPRSPYWQLVETIESPSLDGLLATMLIKILQQRLRIGLGGSYIVEQRLWRGVRGRIDFTNSLKQHAFERGQICCQFQHYSINGLKNQIIRSTLFHLGRGGQFGPNQSRGDKLRHTLRWLVRTLEGIDIIELTPDLIHREQLNRHDHDYRVMLAICDLILQRRLPTEIAGHLYISQLERDRLVLHRLYERFVANFYRHHLPTWTIHPQKTVGWHEQSPNSYLPIMRPDLMLQENQSGRLVILDTKFTINSLRENRWGKEMFDSSHLYQIYTYLKTQAHLSPSHQQATGILLYPAVNHQLSEQINLPEHQIRIECVDLAAPWQVIEQNLLDIFTG